MVFRFPSAGVFRMSNEQKRFWAVQVHRIKDAPSDPPLFDQPKAHLLFRSGRHRLNDAIETLVRVGPLHSASSDELHDLAQLSSGLVHAIALELSLRGSHRLFAVRLDNDLQYRELILSSVSPL